MENKKKDISIFIVARTASSRCPDKVIRDFSQGKSLFEIMCERMQTLRYPTFAAVGEPILSDIANKQNIPIIHRTKEEINSHGPLRRVFACVEQCKTTHIMLISPCTPFLQTDVINAACDFFVKNEYQAITSAIREQNWFFDQDRKPFFPIDVRNMTSNDLCIYALANAFEIFPVERFLNEGIYYTFEDPCDPYLYEIPKAQAVDIDSEEDFNLASYMWEMRGGE